MWHLSIDEAKHPDRDGMSGGELNVMPSCLFQKSFGESEILHILAT